MTRKSTALTLAAALGAALSLTPAFAAEANPFAAVALDKGYMVASSEGKCGAGKCGGAMAKEDKCGGAKTKEDKCGGAKAKEGKCGGSKKSASEGKYGGEGKCGGAKAKEGKCGGTK